MTLAVDFDGVIHAYSCGWHDGTIYDPPMLGALDGLRQLMGHDAVFIFTAREPAQVAEWLSRRGFICRTEHDSPFWNVRDQLLVTNLKLAANSYLDDRAVHFTSWDQALADLLPKPASEPQDRRHPTPFECTRQNRCNTCAVCWR